MQFTRLRLCLLTGAMLLILCSVNILRKTCVTILRPTAPTSGSDEVIHRALTRKYEIEQRMKGPLQEDDPILISIIREKYLLPPSTEPYNFRYKKSARNGIVAGRLVNSILADLFPTKQNGFFVEAGALDGEYMSNTLQLERVQGWQGLLVEPDADNFAKLKERHRKAWLSPTCLATHAYPETVVLQRPNVPQTDFLLLNQGTMKIIQKSTLDDPDTLYNSLLTFGQCVPLQSLLLALNVSHVDFFVLDVEQVERAVLEHFPFDRITVDVWTIEHITLFNWEDTEFVQFMIGKGYYYFDSLCLDVGEYIFVRKGSELYVSLEVPDQNQNRTEICPFKKSPGFADKNVFGFRDGHHSPTLKYKDIPLPSSTNLSQMSSSTDDT